MAAKGGSMGVGAALAALVLAAPQPAGAAPRPGPVTIGYIPAFKDLDRAVAGADFSQYSHINIAFANPDPAGEIAAVDRLACMPAGPDASVTPASLRRAIGAAQAAGSKVMVSLGGGVIPPCSGDWAQLLRPERRQALVGKLIRLVEDYGLDGIDVDLEGELLTRIDKAGDYTPFIAALGAELRPRGKLLTCATASYEGGMVPPSSLPYFDYVTVMSYDAIGPSWGQAGSEHSTYAQAKRDLELWLARGVPRQRLVLGVPFYGYGFGGYKPNYALRDVLAQFGSSALRRDVAGRLCPGCAYVTYNGLDTLKRKTRLARRRAGGIMVWEISQDTDDHRLIRTLGKTLRKGAGKR
jgi:chitinase